MIRGRSKALLRRVEAALRSFSELVGQNHSTKELAPRTNLELEYDLRTGQDEDRARAIRVELERRQRRIQDLDATLFGQQSKCVHSEAKRVVLRCSRRAGKTKTAAAKLARTLDQAGFEEVIVYAARTRIVAKRLIWRQLKRIKAVHGFDDWRFNESELTITTPRGAQLIVVGLNHEDEIEKLRGIKLRLFIGDEPDTYSSILQTLYEEILEPAAADVDGEIWFVGTPGEVLAGFWYDVSNGTPRARINEEEDEEELEDWELHAWTMFDNPHMRDPRRFLQRVLRRRGVTEDNAKIQREFFGQWRYDDEASVYKYLPNRNDVHEVPGFDPKTWAISIAVDFGVSGSAFAWAVTVAHREKRESFTIRAGKRQGLITDEMEEIVAKLVAEFPPDVLWGDPGGGGAALIKQWNRRHKRYPGAIAMQAAKKTEKRAFQEEFNNDLRSGRHKFLQPACREITAEMEVLPWADIATKLKEHPAYANDGCDAALYSWRGLKTYLHVPRERQRDKPAPDSDEAFERDLERFASGRRKGKSWLDLRAIIGVFAEPAHWQKTIVLRAAIV